MLILFLSVKTDTPKALWASRENARWAIWRNIPISLFDTRQSVFARPGHLRCSPIPAMQPIRVRVRKSL